jgi:transcriptional regulator with XRE-family HTH domain
MEKKSWLELEIERYKDDGEFQFEGLKLAISERICELLEQRTMNRKQLAEKLGCSNAYITKLLRGDENLTLKKLFEVTRVLDCKLEIGMQENECHYTTFKYFVNDRFDASRFSEPVEVIQADPTVYSVKIA